VLALKADSLPSQSVLRGQIGRAAWSLPISFNDAPTHGGLSVYWARKKIAALMDETYKGGAEETIRKAVLDVALAHHLVSRYTSLVAVDVTPARPTDSPVAERDHTSNLARAQGLTALAKPPEDCDRRTRAHSDGGSGTSVVLLAVAIPPGGRMSRFRPGSRLLTILIAGLLAIGGWQVWEGSWIYAKARLAQVLLQRAWSRALAGEAMPKPWPWADTWPVARLRMQHPSVDLIVLAGAYGRTLAFGPGHVTSSALPGQEGTVMLTGHRDTHFRFLKE
jgi:hypothetical protein